MDLHIGLEAIPLILIVLYVTWKAGKVAGKTEAWREIARRNRMSVNTSPPSRRYRPESLRVLRETNGSHD